MRILNRISLFLSSFAPLFLLIILKEIIEILNQNWSINFLNIFLLIFLFILFNLGVFGLFFNIHKIKKSNGKKIKIIFRKNNTDQHFLGYFSLFVLFAVTFEIEMYSMAIIFFLILIFIGIVYIKNDMYYINPLLNMLGYSFYCVNVVIDDKDNELCVFYKGAIEANKEYIILDTFKNFIIVKDV